MPSEGNDTQARQTKVSQPKDKCIDADDGGGLGTSANQSRRIGDVANEAGNPTGKRRDSDGHVKTKRGKIFGGILRQLIEEHDDQLAEYRSKLAEYQSKIEKLEQKRYQLQELYEQLQVDTCEGEESPDEVQVRLEEE